MSPAGPQPRDPGVVADKCHDRCIPFGEGAFQVRILLITVFSGTVCLVHISIMWLSLREMDHWCLRPAAFVGLSVAAWKEMAIPRDASGSYSRCTVRDPPDGGPSARVVPCTSWEFNLTEYGNTVVSEWNLVCDRRWMATIAPLVAYALTILSLPLVGTAADRVGRKTVAVVSLTGLLLSLLSSALALDFQTYVVMNAVAMATSSALIVMYIVIYEVTTKSRRLVYSIIAPALPAILVPVFSILVDVYKLSWSSSHLLVAVLVSLLLIAFYTVEESFTWLVTKRNIAEAERVAVRAARLNGVATSECRDLFRRQLQQERVEMSSGEIATSTRSASLRSRTLLLAFVWLSISWPQSQFSGAHGVSLDPQLRAVAYLGTGLTYLFVWPYLQGGRRVKATVATFALATGALTAILYATITDEYTALRAVLLVSMLLSRSVPITLMFFLAANLYPTEARCLAVSTGYACATLGDNMGKARYWSLFGRTDDHKGLAIESVLLAMAAVAAIHLPSDDGCDGGHRFSDALVQRTGSRHCE